MIVDSSHKKWIWLTVFLFLLSAGAYVPYHFLYSVNGPRGSSWPGLAYGIAGTILMVFAGLIGVRRKLRSWHLGRAETWLKGHVWLGLLSYPLILFHAGFRLGGALTVVLMVLFTLVVATGLHGLVAQHIIPRLMTVQVPAETMYEQIPRVLERLREEAAQGVAAVCGAVEAEPPVPKAGHAPKPPKPAQEGSAPLKTFYLNEVKPFLVSGRGRLAVVTSRDVVFSDMRTLLPPPLHATLATLEDICEDRRQLAVQTWLHGWLHGWLLIHLPLAIALMALSAVHAFTALYY